MIRTRLDAPIVLAHGLFGFRRIGLGKLTLTSYFRGIPEALRGAGNRVIVTSVPPIAGVKRRARVLAEQIELVFPGQAVHLIGHSMGGLDSRQLLALPGWSNRVLSLTTVGTPHLGSAIADLARLRVGRVYRLLRMLGVEHRGFLDVTRRAARAVSRNGVTTPDIPCYCVAGDPAPDQVYWTIRPFYDILSDLEGPNDGLVSVESAEGFGQPLPAWPVDHLRQMSWHSPSRGPSSKAAVLALYDSLLANLAAQGFGAPVAAEPEPVASGSRHQNRLFVFGGLPVAVRGLAGRAVQQHRDRHVAEDV